jgi:hypothetical protein
MVKSSRNDGKTGVRVCLIITILGFAMGLLPFIIEIDMMKVGYALVFMGGFVFLSGLICLFIFNKRAKVLHRMTIGDVVARWKYDQAFWEKLVDKEISNWTGLKTMGVFLGGLFAVMGIVSLLADEDNSLFFYIMIGFAILFSSVGFLSYGFQKRRLMKDPGEVIITRDGVYFMGNLTDWNGVTSILDAVGFHPSNPDVLVFSYRTLAGRIPRMMRSTLHLPIPQGMEDQAAMAVQFFNLPLHADDMNK